MWVCQIYLGQLNHWLNKYLSTFISPELSNYDKLLHHIHYVSLNTNLDNISSVFSTNYELVERNC